MADKENTPVKTETQVVAPNVIKIHDGAPYAIAKMEPERFRDLMNANVTGAVDEFDFDRVSIPGGGGLAWAVPDINGEPEPEKEVVGIPIIHGDRRAYWQTAYEDSGGGSPPDCSSQDATTGTGWIRGESIATHPQPTTRACRECPMAQWGSKLPDDPEDNQQACSHRKLVAMMRPNDMLPLVMDLAPTSVKVLSRFLLKLVGKDVSCYSAIVGLKLKNEQARGGSTYSVVLPSLKARLTSADEAVMKKAAETFAPVFQQITIEQESTEG